VGHFYGQNSGLFYPDGIIFPKSGTRPGDVVDGLSNTILVVETREADMTVWMDGGTAAVVAQRYDEDNAPTYAGPEIALNYHPYFDYIDPRAEYGPSSFHAGGATHLFADASVRFVSDKISVWLYVAISTKDGMEVVTGGNF
jgi:hypothetical protein